MRVRMTLAAAVAAGLTMGACAPAGAPGAGLASPYSSARAVSGASSLKAESGLTVRVENRNWSDVVIYAMRAGRSYRLGMVTSMNTIRFRLPPGLSVGGGDIRLVVDPVGSGRRFTTAPVMATAGQEVAFTVENHLPISSVSVWNRRNQR